MRKQSDVEEGRVDGWVNKNITLYHGISLFDSIFLKSLYIFKSMTTIIPMITSLLLSPSRSSLPVNIRLWIKGGFLWY